MKIVLLIISVFVLVVIIGGILGLIQPTWINVKSRKEAFEGILGGLFILMVCGVINIIFYPSEEKAPLTQETVVEQVDHPEKTVEEPEASKPTLPVTTSEFQSFFDKIVQEHSLEILTVSEREKGINSIQFAVKGIDYIMFMVTERAKDRKLMDITMIFSGSEEETKMEAGAIIVLMMISAIGASHPELEPQERGKVFKLLNLEKLTETSKNRATYRGIKYLMIQGFFIIEPSSDKK